LLQDEYFLYTKHASCFPKMMLHCFRGDRKSP
jgi:hypothetical protein